MKKNNNKSAFTIAELILTTVIMAIVCVVAPVIILKRDVKPQKAKKFNNIVECKTKCIYDAHTSTLTYLDEKGTKTESVLDYNKNTNEFYTIILVGGGAGGTSKSKGYPGETKTIMIPTLDENQDITNDSNDGTYKGILTGYYLMEIGDGGEVNKNGKRTKFCTIKSEDTNNINTVNCEDDNIIASAEGGIASAEDETASAEDGTASNENEESNIKLKNGDTFGNGGKKNGKGVGGLVIIK